MEFVLPPPPATSVAVAGTTARFPVRRIFCVGRNYADHVREMGGNPMDEPPIFFTKPADALVADGADVPYPPGTGNLHHEVELVVAIGAMAKDVTMESALGAVWGYGVGNDLTRRDLQAAAKAKGAPWDTAKAFDHSAPISALRPQSDVGHPAKGRIELSVNGTVRQSADLSEMIWPVPAVIAHLSRLFTLMPGDLIFTGTPAGVGPVERGDVIECAIDGVGTLVNRIV